MLGRACWNDTIGVDSKLQAGHSPKIAKIKLDWRAVIPVRILVCVTMNSFQEGGQIQMWDSVSTDWEENVGATPVVVEDSGSKGPKSLDPHAASMSFNPPWRACECDRCEEMDLIIPLEQLSRQGTDVCWTIPVGKDLGCWKRGESWIRSHTYFLRSKRIETALAWRSSSFAP